MPAIAVNGNSVLTPLWSPATVVISKAGVVRVNGQAVVVEGDTIPSHTRFLNPTHTTPAMMASQSAVRVNGSSVIINGDRATCISTHVVAASSGSVSIN